jgi:hypothetical protein
MRHSLAVAPLALALFGCGSDNPTTPSAACDAIAVAVCDKEYACQPALAGTASGCAAAAETEENCATSSCPVGTTFNSSNAATCLSAINNGSCNLSLPDTCSELCE